MRDTIDMAREAGESIDKNWLERFAALVRADEREHIAQMIDNAPALVEYVTNDQGGCLMCGFTPKLAAASIRARSNT